MECVFRHVFKTSRLFSVAVLFFPMDPHFHRSIFLCWIARCSMCLYVSVFRMSWAWKRSRHCKKMFLGFVFVGSTPHDDISIFLKSIFLQKTQTMGSHFISKMFSMSNFGNVFLVQRKRFLAMPMQSLPQGFLYTYNIYNSMCFDERNSIADARGETHVGCQKEHGIGNCGHCNRDDDGFKQSCIEMWATEGVPLPPPRPGVAPPAPPRQ